MADTGNGSGSPDRVLAIHAGTVLGYLIRRCGDFDLAEDIRQDVMLAALKAWRLDGVPSEALAWLISAARNRLTDHYRHRAVTDRFAAAAGAAMQEDAAALDDSDLADDLLRLIFTCCHPALAPGTSVALTLKSVAGFHLDEVARAFVVTPAAMEQRLLRAKRKLRQAGIAFEIPEGRQLGVRLEAVMQTLYLMFNEGYSATSGNEPVRRRLCAEAIRVTALMQSMFVRHAELQALLALMLLHDARAGARVSADGDIVLLPAQDRSRFNHTQITEGTALLEHALALKQPPGPYQVQAAIAALHASESSPEETDWPQIVLLYEKLLEVSPGPVVALNLAVARMMTGDLETARATLKSIAPDLNSYFPFYIACSRLAQESGDPAAARDALLKARALECNESEREHLERLLTELG